MARVTNHGSKVSYGCLVGAASNAVLVVVKKQ